EGDEGLVGEALDVAGGGDGSGGDEDLTDDVEATSLGAPLEGAAPAATADAALSGVVASADRRPSAKIAPTPAPTTRPAPTPIPRRRVRARASTARLSPLALGADPAAANAKGARDDRGAAASVRNTDAKGARTAGAAGSSPCAPRASRSIASIVA